MKTRLYLAWLVVILPVVSGFQIPFHQLAMPQQEPYQDIAIEMYPLTATGGIDTSNPEEPLCQVDDPTTEQNEADTRWGCTAYPNDESLAYPYSANPATVSVEADYLLDVVPREMGTTHHHDLALRVQAIAARTYAYCAIYAWEQQAAGNTTYWGNCLKEINNSNTFQVFVPYYFDTLSTTDQTRIQDAVAGVLYTKDSAEPQRGAIFAEFSADAYLRTIAGDYTYLTSVEDPISYDPAIPGIIDATGAHQRGMSQDGANRWAWGSSSQYEGQGTPWPVRWDDYRQILVHYYTGIDILNGAGNKVAPDDRWNLLWHDNFGFPVGETLTLNNAQTYSLQLQLQNTSVADWAENEVMLGYQWTVRGVGADPANWLALTTLPALEKGASTPNRDNSPLTVLVPAPCGTGEYTLHLDVGRNGNWFSAAGWHDTRIDVTVQMGTPQASSGRGYYTDGLGVMYYNDEDDGQWLIGGEITWQTFTPPIVFSTVEPHINFDTDTSSPAPGVNGTFWSAIWEGNLYVPQTGQYRFYLGGLDDGGRLKIDGDTHIESWLVQGPHEYFSPLVPLSQGLHAFRVEYAQGPGLEAGLSVCWDGPSFGKEVIGPSGVIPGLPTPTPFFTPTPVPTATPTFTPSPTPLPTDTPTPAPTSPPPWWPPAEQVLMQDEPASKQEAFSDLLSRIRDKILLSDPKGEAYVQMIYHHAPEITKLLAEDEHFRVQVKALVLEIQPLLEATIAEQPLEEPRLSAAWVERAVSVLDEIEPRTSPELREEIRWWKERLPDWVGKTGLEIWEMLPERTK